MNKKIMEIKKNNDVYVLVDKWETLDVPNDYASLVSNGQKWLIALDNGSVMPMVECRNSYIEVYEGNQKVIYEMDREPAILTNSADKQSIQQTNQPNKTNSNSNIYDVLQKSHNLKSSKAVLESGREVDIQCKVRNNSLVRYCTDLDTVQIVPLDTILMQQIIAINSPGSYDPNGGVYSLDNDNKLDVNVDDLPLVLEDMVVQASVDSNNIVYGNIRSSHLSNEPHMELGTHTGKYEVNPKESTFITPTINWNVSGYVQNCTQYNFEPISYDTFKDCLLDYLNTYGSTMTSAQLVQYMDLEYVNFNTQPMTLSIYDKIQFQKQFLYVNDTEYTHHRIGC